MNGLSCGPGTVSELTPKSADTMTGIFRSFAYPATASPTALLTMPFSMWTPSRSTSFRAFVSPTSGLPSSSSTRSSIGRSFTFHPISSKYIFAPSSASRPLRVKTPVSGTSIPIFTGVSG